MELFIFSIWYHQFDRVEDSIKRWEILSYLVFTLFFFKILISKF